MYITRISCNNKAQKKYLTRLKNLRYCLYYYYLISKYRHRKKKIYSLFLNQTYPITSTKMFYTHLRYIQLINIASRFIWMSMSSWFCTNTAKSPYISYLDVYIFVISVIFLRVFVGNIHTYFQFLFRSHSNLLCTSDMSQKPKTNFRNSINPVSLNGKLLHLYPMFYLLTENRRVQNEATKEFGKLVDARLRDFFLSLVTKQYKNISFAFRLTSSNDRSIDTIYKDISYIMSFSKTLRLEYIETLRKGTFSNTAAL